MCYRLSDVTPELLCEIFLLPESEYNSFSRQKQESIQRLVFQAMLGLRIDPQSITSMQAEALRSIRTLQERLQEA